VHSDLKVGLRTLLAQLVTLTMAAALAGTCAFAADPQYGIAMHGVPKEPVGFAHFPYVNPDAAKGGKIVLGQSGSFDNLNSMIVNGEPAAGIREFLVEPLMARSLDEPFTLYGLLAESIEVPDDRSEITFNINPKARFSDGKPVTADDVLFSLNILREKGRPNHRTYFKKVKTAERLSDLKVRFVFEGQDRELPLILGVMPVLAKHAFDPETFETTTLKPFVSSGPYLITQVQPGASLTYTRDPNYWGRDLPVNRGRFNFDEIRFEYYREPAALLEAFLTGSIDVRSEDDPARWAEGYDRPALKDGRMLKAEFATGLPAGMMGLAFNSRRAVFRNPAVREALTQVFNFEWVNRNLFHGLYKRTESFFERSYLSSIGRPADAHERALLAPFADAVTPAILEGSFRQPASDGTPNNRNNAKTAYDALIKNGFKLDNGVLRDTEGIPLTFEILAGSSAQERLLLSYANDLARLGITAKVRVVDSAQYQSRLKNYDYDMIQFPWPSSLSPGNEQLFRWSSKVAAQPGSFNYPGVESPAADAMIEAMLTANTAEDFASSVRALDRVLLSGHYVAPLFHVPKQWVAHWAHMKYPSKTPISGYNLDSWWMDKK
jgi:peptide/nickel transport system substrate-binding protein